MSKQDTPLLPLAASRRGFFAASSAAAAAAITPQLFAQVNSSTVTPGDIAILKFLAAAELIEDDLWQQYCELAVNNPAYNRALRRIDRSLVRYICDDRDDERSHAALINAFLVAIGQQPVNLDPFRRLPSVSVTGAEQRGRITNLRNLNVDTSWFLRYRSAENPDLGATFPQFVAINSRDTIPVSNSQSENQIQLAAHAAAFHFCAIEQGGGSLYNGLLSKVTSLDTLAIVAAIGPTEIIHFTGFHKSLENLPAFSFDGLSFPNIRDNRELGEGIFPEPCRFLDPNFPLCSVVRPRSNANSGPLAAATGLVQSNLFAGQGNDFFDAVVALATAADNAVRAF
jgi:hypothetical protein